MKLESLMEVLDKESNVVINLTTMFPLEGQTQRIVVSFPVSEADDMMCAYLGVEEIEIHKVECYHWKGDGNTVQMGVILDPDLAQESALVPLFEDYGEECW